MPEMIVWPVSASVCTRNVGSSSASLLSAMRQLVLVGLRLRLDRHVDDGRRELHRLEDDRLVLVAQRVAGARVLEADRRGDVAGAHFLDLLALVRVHLEQAADALALVLGRVVDVRPGLEHARVDAEERQLSDERVGRDLERQRRERRVVASRRALSNVSSWCGRCPLIGRHVDRRRQVVDHRVEQRLHALVLERRAAEHRHELAIDRRRADRVADLVDRQLLAVRRYFSISSSSCSTAASISVVPRLLDRILHVVGHVDHRERLAERLFVEDVLLALDDVDVAGEELARADRQLQRIGVSCDRRSRIIAMQRSKFAPTRSILFAKIMRGTP